MSKRAAVVIGILFLLSFASNVFLFLLISASGMNRSVANALVANNARNIEVMAEVLTEQGKEIEALKAAR